MANTNTGGSRRQARLLMLLILLLAFGLRVYHLDFQSFWTDEGRSLLRASVPLAQVADATPVEHMPTYFALLHVWIGLAGASDFAIRFLSVWPSVLAVAIAFGFAAELGSVRAGLIGAVLLATGAFQVWYAQEARMYTWLLATGLLSTWLLWRLLNRWPTEQPPKVAWPREREYYLTFAGYVLATTATIYLHHFGLAVALAQAVFVLIWLAATRDLRAFMRWVVAGLSVALLYLPVAPRVLGISNYTGWRQTIVAWDRIPLYFLTAYVAGDTMPEPWHTWLPWLYLVLIIAGTVAWWRTNRLGGLLLILSAAMPVAVAWGMAWIKPQFHERYTMLVTGPLILLAANGLTLFDPAFWRRKQPSRNGSWPLRRLSALMAAVVLVGVIAANLLALDQLYHNDAIQKPDYRAVAARIQASEKPGDVILTFTNSWEDTFLHYYRGKLPLRNMPPTEPARTLEQTLSMMRDATAGAQRAWLVEQHGGAEVAMAWLDQNAWLASEFDSNSLHLALYGLQELPRMELPSQIPFGPDLILNKVTLAGGSGEAGTTFHAGDVIGVTTHWQELKATKPLMFSLRLVDSTGRNIAITEYMPLTASPDPDLRRPGIPPQDLRGVLLSPDLPPGQYEISLTLYDPETGAVVQAGDQPGARLAQIEVLPAAVPPEPADLPIPVRLEAALGEELELLGFGIDPDPARPDAATTLYLWWRARSQPARPYQVEIELVGRDGETIAKSLQPLSSVPSDSWQKGQILGERYPLAIDPGAVSGDYELQVTLMAPDGAVVGQTLPAGDVEVEARPRTYRLPFGGHRLDARVGEHIALRKYALEGPAGSEAELRLTLYWQADAPITGQYKVFVHLVDDDGRIVAQHDSFPADGAAPTESWRKGEVIADTHVLAVPAPGHYRILAGLYDPATGQRLPVWDEVQQPGTDNAIEVTDVQAP